MPACKPTNGRIGKAIRLAREKKSLTQRAVATYAKVAQGTLSTAERSANTTQEFADHILAAIRKMKPAKPKAVRAAEMAKERSKRPRVKATSSRGKTKAVKPKKKAAKKVKAAPKKVAAAPKKVAKKKAAPRKPKAAKPAAVVATPPAAPAEALPAAS